MSSLMGKDKHRIRRWWMYNLAVLRDKPWMPSLLLKIIDHIRYEWLYIKNCRENE